MREVPLTVCGATAFVPLSCAVPSDGPLDRRHLTRMSHRRCGKGTLAGLRCRTVDRLIAEEGGLKRGQRRMGFLLDVGLGLPHALALGGHAAGRRGAEHPPDSQRLRSARRALLLDERRSSCTSGQPDADRHAHRPA